MPDCPAELRRSLRLLPSKGGTFALFCGTSSKVVNYSPARASRDMSTKVTKSGLELFPPLRLVSSPDSFLGKRKRDSKFPLAFLFGRPMWGAFAEEGVSSKDLVRLAVTKMLGGLQIGAEKVTRALAAAMFGVAAGSTAVCTGSIAEDMVASHMATLLCISEDRELLKLCQTSEPVLGEAVARLFRRYNYLGPALDHLCQLCDDGLVLEKVRGELVAKIIVLLAMYEAAEVSGAAFYSTPVRVVDFFKALLGAEAAGKLERLAQGSASRTFQHGKMCFNHFLPMTRENNGTDPSTRNTKYTYMPQEKLKTFYQRTAAFMFPEGAEFGLPISLESEFSMCDVQVKDVLSPNQMENVELNGADAIKLILCFTPGEAGIHVSGSQVVVVGGPEQYPCAASYEGVLQQILKARLGVQLEKLLAGNELRVAKTYVSWLYRTDVIAEV